MDTSDDDAEFSGIRKRKVCYGGRPRCVTTTEGPPSGNPDLPQSDRLNHGVVWWFGHRIYLGKDSRIRRLFDFLSSSPGVSFTHCDIQKALEGQMIDESLGFTSAEVKRANQRLRQDASRLRRALQEHGADDHILLVPHKVRMRTDDGDLLPATPALAILRRHWPQTESKPSQAVPKPLGLATFMRSRSPASASGTAAAAQNS